MALPTVFVCGATGCQGGAVARQLRAMNWNVHATARNPESPAAKELLSLGVQVTKGDWDDESALESSIAGCQMLFLNLYPDIQDFSREPQRAKVIIRLAQNAQVKHLIYTSIFPLDDPDPNNLLTKGREAKRSIEEATRTSGFESWTVLQPGYFMANFHLPKVNMYPGATDAGIFTFAFGPETRLPLIDHQDIAKFAIAAFQDPKRFNGQTIILASELTPANKVLEMVSRTCGHNLMARHLSGVAIQEEQKRNPYFAGQLIVPQMAALVDLQKLRSYGVALGTFQEYLERHGDEVVETYRNVKA